MGGEGGGMVECQPNANDFPGDGWDACVSDGGSWVLVGDSAPSSIGRVAAFEQMGDLLWNAGGPPGAEAFIDAQIIFVEDEGLGSRVARRYDSHVPRPMDGIDCRDAEASLPYPDYCVGPVQMLPIINAAFDAGAAGEGNPYVHTGRIEGALLWFFYVSTFKEANTCFGTARDCDSAWAYFGAGASPADPVSGLGALVQAIEPGAYTAVFNALLAVRCWRDLDGGETAENQALFDQAMDQLDRALDYAYGLLIISRLEEYAAAESDFEKEARWANLAILIHSVDRAARLRDAGAADRIAALLEAEEPDVAGAISDLEVLFPCP